ncbi:MAG: hypothetical protein ACJA0Q_000722 [Saprospiraceae bacterium]|jgi:hypothetical protein
MEALILQSSSTTPSINFDVDNMSFTIEGECRPENVLTYFSPIINWLNKFKNWGINLANPIDETLTFHFKLAYYNTSSAKFLFNIFEKMKAIQEESMKVKIAWYYDELDEDLLENGKEFEKILGLDFEFIAME